MACKTILASSVAKVYSDETRDAIVKRGIQPTLVGFLANKDPAARTYAEWTRKSCDEVGIRFEVREVERTELEEHIMEANQDDAVHGIMVYYPVFGNQQDQYLQNCVSPAKDVEGLCHTYRYNMYHNIRYLDKAQTKKCIIPCTPLAVVKALEYVHIYNPMLAAGSRLYGKTITIINRSEIVGRPLAALLANDGAKVYSVDITGILEFHRGEGLKSAQHQAVETSVSLDQALAAADVVITGVPSPSYKVPVSKLKTGVVAINFSTAANFDKDAIRERASIYMPSIGKITVSMLQRNLVRLYEYQQPAVQP
ncbi:Methylenetetrahydrofolate dehydrogenase [NAD(+)] [Sorochytrium milnesiophthora]